MTERGVSQHGVSGDDPVWLTPVQVRMLHAEAVARFGGPPGVRDEGLLESALGRPRNLWTYSDDATVFDVAAAYGLGITQNHPFVDGNKRTSALVIRAFLFRNGYRFAPPEQTEMVTVFEGIASGRMDADALAGWIEKNSAPR